ncbi:hypothetical protein Agub_g1077 [Astrephomene gubernaculifera]|uniref:Uncharacterized protein n=1 Tax=Astrephomene gubernaculifera TaxID=47775 RepID=A0AAD3DH02_9CHLO|nr:hypothetical protein Agub_g1077 [Astrephomene gubernaculifera]
MSIKLLKSSAHARLYRGGLVCRVPRMSTVPKAMTTNGRLQAISCPAHHSSTALSVMAAAAAGTLLAKLSALMAAGVAPGVVLALLHSSSAMLKPTESFYHHPLTLHGALPGKVAIAQAPTPATQPTSSALPSEWFIATSAAQWLDQHRLAAASGALLATVFVSDKAARAHAPLLERLRRSYGTGPAAPVRFVFVHIGPGFARRNHACCAAAAAPRGSQALVLGHLAHTAAVHGLDVALSSLLPGGIRAFPSVLLTAPSGGSARCCAASRVGELTQLVSDWAFINRSFALALARGRAAGAGGVGAESAEGLRMPDGGELAARAREEVRKSLERAVSLPLPPPQQRPLQLQQQRSGRNGVLMA